MFELTSVGCERVCGKLMLSAHGASTSTKPLAIKLSYQQSFHMTIIHLTVLDIHPELVCF